MRRLPSQFGHGDQTRETSVQLMKVHLTLVVNGRRALLLWWSVGEGPTYFGAHLEKDLLTLLVSRRRSTLLWSSFEEETSYIDGQ